MPFIDDIENRGAAHLMTDRDLRNLAVKNIWKGIMIVEKIYGIRVCWKDKVDIIGDVCRKKKEPLGQKAIEKIIAGVNVHDIDIEKYKKQIEFREIKK